MKKIILVLPLCLLLMVVFSGCAGFIQAPFIPGYGALYASYKAPLNVELDGTKLGTKTGTASAENILGLIATGDASIQAAAAAGNIKTINHADYELQNILGVYSKTTVIVYGD